MSSRDQIFKEAVTQFEQLKKEVNANSSKNLADLFSALKVKLTQLDFLAHKPNAPQQELLLAREVLELGANYAIRTKDLISFERQINQLFSYYFDYTGFNLPQSQRMYPLLGLHLLFLLTQSRIAEFHTQLERFDTNLLSSNIYLKHPIHLEQCLMEGSYNKVLSRRNDVPSEEYVYFMDILMQTIRDEIGSCCEKAYDYLPLQNATALFYLSNNADLMAFIQKRSWIVDAVEKKIYFKTVAKNEQQTSNNQLVKELLGYALELEKIV